MPASTASRRRAPGRSCGARSRPGPGSRRPPRPAALPAAPQLPPHTGERRAAGGVLAASAETSAARRRVPPRLLVRRRDGGALPAARRGILLLRHGGPSVPAAGARALRLFPLPRLRGAVREQLHGRDAPRLGGAPGRLGAGGGRGVRVL